MASLTFLCQHKSWRKQWNEWISADGFFMIILELKRLWKNTQRPKSFSFFFWRDLLVAQGTRNASFSKGRSSTTIIHHGCFTLCSIELPYPGELTSIWNKLFLANLVHFKFGSPQATQLGIFFCTSPRDLFKRHTIERDKIIKAQHVAGFEPTIS